MEQLIGRLKDILEKDCQKTLEDLARKREKSEANFGKAVKNLELAGALKKKAQMLPELVYLRTYRFDIFTLSAYYMRPFLLEIASRFGLTYDEFIYLTLSEISELLLGEKEISEIPIKKRVKDYALIQIDGQFEVIVDEERLQALREEKEEVVSNVKEIRGSVACKGKARGPVKIVMHATQVTKVEKGDVLVAPMTSPDFVVAMLKAVAIVTDHGGVTCHAAIVSRELNIPCVIGTKIATKVLKNGEMVEVDAEKGVVKKL